MAALVRLPMVEQRVIFEAENDDEIKFLDDFFSDIVGQQCACALPRV
jgi:hypothetical protein